MENDYPTSISVKESTRRRLTQYGRKGETYETIIIRLMDGGGQTILDRGTPEQTNNALADGPQGRNVTGRKKQK